MTTETIEVDVYGIKVPLPKEQADKVIAQRDAEKVSRRELAEKVGKSEADKAAAESAKLKAEEDKTILELASKKETEQIRALAAKDITEKMGRVSIKLRDKHLAATLATNKSLVSTAIPDVVEALKTRIAYDLESDAIVVLDAAGQPAKDDAGKPVQVDAWISEWIGKRPHYLLDKTPAGSGASGAHQPKLSGPKPKFTRLDVATGKVPQALVENGGYEIEG